MFQLVANRFMYLQKINLKFQMKFELIKMIYTLKKYLMDGVNLKKGIKSLPSFDFKSIKYKNNYDYKYIYINLT